MCYVEGWGSGFLRVNAEPAEYGAGQVAIEDAGVATRLNVYRVASQTMENKFADDEPNDPNREPNEPNESKDIAGIILITLAKDPSATIPDLMEVCHVSRESIKRALKTLKAVGRIRRKGGTRGVWEVLS